MQFTVQNQEYILSAAGVYDLTAMKWFTNLNGTDKKWTNSATASDIYTLFAPFVSLKATRTEVMVYSYQPFSTLTLQDIRTVQRTNITGTLDGLSTDRVFSESKAVDLYKSRNYYSIFFSFPALVIPVSIDFGTLPTATGQQAFFVKQLIDVKWI